MEANEIVYTAREEIADFFGFKDASRVIFTSNCTEGLNLAIKGILEKGDHCLISSMEHNSVIRPVNRLLKDQVIEYDIVQADSTGLIDPQGVKDRIKNNTKLIICSHASNVNGIIQPIKEIAEICRQHDLIFLVDAAQSAGNVPISAGWLGVDILAAPGHKYLLGPQGTGILLLNRDIRLKTLKEGGTGTFSGNTTQPETLPERYESGTLNLLGIGGLLEGIRYIRDTGMEKMRNKKKDLYLYLIEKLNNIDSTMMIGVTTPEQNTGVISIQLKNNKTADLANVLGNKYDIKFRYGLHCAPLAHHTLGTFPEGTIRFSPGFKNGKGDIDILVDAIQNGIEDL
jgi:cysteine desulfurase family protein